MASRLINQIAILIRAIRHKLKWGSLLPERTRGFEFDSSNVERYFVERDGK